MYAPPVAGLRAGFTLIELLVVISIIAILASMLLPAVGMIRDMAMSAKCASNLRQFQLSTIAYTSDWDGLYYIGRAGGIDEWIWNTHGLANDFMEQSWDTARGTWWSTRIQCPTVDLGKYVGMTLPTPSYGINSPRAWTEMWFGPSDYGVPVGTWIHRPIDRIPQKADKVAYVDAGDSQATFIWYPPSDFSGNGGNPDRQLEEQFAPRAWNTISIRHRARANVVFWDGHGGSFTHDRLNVLANLEESFAFKDF